MLLSFSLLATDVSKKLKFHKIFMASVELQHILLRFHNKTKQVVKAESAKVNLPNKEKPNPNKKTLRGRG